MEGSFWGGVTQFSPTEFKEDCRTFTANEGEG